MANWASTPGCTPGTNKAVNLHKSIASGAAMPGSARTIKVPGLKGSSTGGTKVPGLANR